jgi:hypothetical protein
LPLLLLLLLRLLLLLLLLRRRLLLLYIHSSSFSSIRKTLFPRLSYLRRLYCIPARCCGSVPLCSGDTLLR